MSNSENGKQSKLYNTLKIYTETTRSFHMPGHKNGRLSLIEDVYDLDVTEVPGTDDMHHTEGILKEALADISEIYGSGKSYFLVNGSTGGILAAISSICGFTNKILVARNCHKSVYNSLLLKNLEATYIYPRFYEKGGFYGPVEVDDLESLENEGLDFYQFKAMVVTSPTYEGQVSDIEGISRFLHDRGITLIVDEAHGAHLNFCSRGPKSALNIGADLVVQSTHKTLPCLTQTGLLHVSCNALEAGRVAIYNLEKYLAIYQSSSPSYVLMTSIVEGVAYMDRNRVKLNTLGEELEAEVFTRNKDNSYMHWLMGANHDIFRLTGILRRPNKDLNMDNLTGWEIDSALRETKSIQVEMSGMNHILGIVTIADDMEGIKMFMNAVEEVTENLVRKNEETNKGEKIEIKDIYFHKPTRELSIFEAEEGNKSSIDIEEAKGMIAGEFIVPYPPGIPLLVPGEKIEDVHIDLIRNWVSHNKDVYGVNKKAEICYTYVIDNNIADD